MQSNSVTFMKNNNLTIRNLAKRTGISRSTLSYKLKQPVNKWNYGMLQSIAKVTNTTPDQIANEFTNGGWHLNINDKKHTIQGVYCGNKMKFLTTKDAVINEYFEGWRPTSKEIKALIDSAKHPDADLKIDMIKYIKEAKKQGIYLDE